MTVTVKTIVEANTATVRVVPAPGIVGKICAQLTIMGFDGTISDETDPDGILYYGHYAYNVPPALFQAATTATGLATEPGMAGFIRTAIRTGRLVSMTDAPNESADIRLEWEIDGEPSASWTVTTAARALRSIGILTDARTLGQDAPSSGPPTSSAPASESASSRAPSAPTCTASRRGPSRTPARTP